jgi:hypothetical protein
VGAPALIKPSKEGRQETVVVLPGLGGVRQKVCAHVLGPGDPDSLQGEAARELGLKELQGKTLQGRIGGAARDELPPGLAPDREGGYYPAHNEDAAEVIHKHSEAATAEEWGCRRDERGDAPQLA